MASSWQGSLFGFGVEIGPRPLGGSVAGTDLGDGAWVEFCPSWLAGADELFDLLIDGVRWRAERRLMYDRMVDVPRLVAYYGEGVAPPVSAVAEARASLTAHYRGRCGEELKTTSLCLYRDGRDSVAWHGDRIGRATDAETLVAIVSLGAVRRLLLRQKGGGRGLRFDLASGDLLVMGGTCQRTWEHSVPKTARAVGPRISMQFRSRPRDGG